MYLRSRNRAAFLASPARHPITADAYYERAVRPGLFERLRERLDRCLTNLLDQPLWDELADLPASAVRVVDALATIDVDGVLVYVAPDLVVRTPRAGWVVIDWKTGADADAGAQLALYGVYLQDGLGLPARDGGYKARIVDLGTGRTATTRVRPTPSPWPPTGARAGSATSASSARRSSRAVSVRRPARIRAAGAVALVRAAIVPAFPRSRPTPPRAITMPRRNGGPRPVRLARHGGRASDREPHDPRPARVSSRTTTGSDGRSDG